MIFFTMELCQVQNQDCVPFPSLVGEKNTCDLEVSNKSQDHGLTCLIFDPFNSSAMYTTTLLNPGINKSSFSLSHILLSKPSTANQKMTDHEDDIFSNMLKKFSV